MFIKKIRFQRTKGAKIESGWWIGKYEVCRRLYHIRF